MGVFDNYIYENGLVVINNNWIEWEHHVDFDFSIFPNWIQDILNTLKDKLMNMFGHCKTCIKLDGCWFVKNIMPKQPLHDRCHCTKFNISKPMANENCFAEMDLRKLTEYVLVDDETSNGKYELFKSWGYTNTNAEELRQLYLNEAIKMYTNGLYGLHKLDQYGQQIIIEINIKDHHIKTGWMIEPKGKIRNITPFGGWM